MAAGIPLAVVGEQARQAGLLIALASPPDGGLITLHLSGDVLPPLTGCDGQDDPSTADLIPGQRPTPSDRLQDGIVSGVKSQEMRLTATHAAVLDAGDGIELQHSGHHEFIASFLRRDTRTL